MGLNVKCCIFFTTLLCTQIASSSGATEAPAPHSRRESISPQSDYTNLAKMVGELILEVPAPAGGTTTSSICSGLAISRKYVVTARHCFLSQTGGVLDYVNAYISMWRTEGNARTYKLKHDFSDENVEGDFVVLEAHEPIVEFAPSLLKSSETILNDGRDLFVLHYPGPGSLVLTRMDCKSAKPAVSGLSFFHTCDTDPGSSGAPIFDGSFNLIGLHLAGGRSGDAASSNRGVTANELLTKSGIIGTAFKEAKVAQGIVTPAPVVEYEYRVSTGALLKKQGSDWVFKRGDDGSATALVEQQGPADMWTLWEPNRDVLFRWPITGGDLKSRSAVGSGHFVVIATVSLTIGPKK